VKIYKSEDTAIGKFGMELKELMEKHDIKTIKPLSWDMLIGFDEDGVFNMVRCDIKTKNVIKSK